LRVLDFGLARVTDPDAESSLATADGAILGTPAFMAPEQARGRWDDVDGQTDIWAVGATMFTLLTGRLVFEAETANEALGLAMMHHAPGILTVMPELPAAIAEVVDRALAYDKSKRFPDAASMRDAVKLVSQSGATSARMPTLSIPDESPATSNAVGTPGVARTAQFTTNRGVTTAAGARGPGGIPLPILAAAGVIVLLGIVVAIFVLRQGTPPSATTVASSAPPPPSQTVVELSPPRPVPVPTVTPKTTPDDDAQVLSFDQLPTALPPSRKVGAGAPPATSASSKKPPASTAPPKDDPFAKRR
jgi:serine/threonine-protein kinase